MVHRAWIGKRNTRKGWTYLVQWMEGGRVKTESAGSDRKLAERLKKLKEYELNSGIASTIKAIRFAEFRTEELRVLGARLAPESAKDVGRILAVFERVCRPHWVKDITINMVETYLTELARKARPATVNKHLRVLKASFNRAIKRNYIRENPADIAKVKEPEKAIRVLSAEEVEKLLDACPDQRWRTFVYLAATTGMRLGEVCNLTWEDLDLENKVVRITNKGTWYTKSRKNRAVGLTGRAVKLLLELRFHSDSSTYVFATATDKPWHNNLQRDFGKIVRWAGVRHCSMQSLRSTFITQLAMAGVNEAVVQAAAGHANITTTLKHYTAIPNKQVVAAPERLPYA